MATLEERLRADLVNTESQLEFANTALQDILESQFDSYDIENMDTRQRATNLKIDKLTKLISYLEKKRDDLYGKLSGSIRRCVGLRTRR